MTENNDLFDMFESEDRARQDDNIDTTRLNEDVKIHKDPSQPPLPPGRRQQAHAERARRAKVRRVRIVSLLVAAALLLGLGYGGYTLIHTIQSARERTTTHTSQSLDYTGPGSGSVEVTFEEGESSSEFAAKLVKAGVVRSEGAFTNAVKLAEAENKLQAGTFTLKYRMASDDVVKILVDSKNVTGSLIIRSGETVEEVISQAARITKIKKSEFEAVMKDANASILPDIAQNKWEGWFEPGTYNIKGEKDVSTILKQIVDKRITELKKLGVDEKNWQIVLTKASIVEGEANADEYYGKVARVIENRLEKNIALGMDSINGYGFGVNGRNLTQSQLEDASNPYNSRIHKGLPPTPINNPGVSAIKAVQNPQKGDWLYFVTVNLDTGETKFTSSQKEFEKFAQEYQEWEKNN